MAKIGQHHLWMVPKIVKRRGAGAYENMILRNEDFFIAFWRKKIIKIRQKLTELEGKMRVSSLDFKGHRRP